MIKNATSDEIKQASLNVADAVNEAGDAIVNGHNKTKASVVSGIVILTFEDGNISTRIAGLVDKTKLYGSLIEAVLSIHEIDKALNLVQAGIQQAALFEKYSTPERTDN